MLFLEFSWSAHLKLGYPTPLINTRWICNIEIHMENLVVTQSQTKSESWKTLEMIFFLNFLYTKTNKQLFNSFSGSRFNKIGMSDVNHSYYLQNICCYIIVSYTKQIINQSSNINHLILHLKDKYAPYFPDSNITGF